MVKSQLVITELNVKWNRPTQGKAIMKVIGYEKRNLRNVITGAGVITLTRGHQQQQEIAKDKAADG